MVSAELALAQSRDDLEIWLASTRRCNTCALYEQVAERRGYGDTLAYEHNGRQLRIPIRRVDKGALRPAIAAQLVGDAGPRSPYWPIQLTVFVVQGGKVLYHGNIAESADLREAQFSAAQMFPPDTPAADHPSLREEINYEEFFLERWNLEYFAAVALGDATARGSLGVIDFAAPAPAPLGATNVVLWGAAGTPLRNGLFTARRMQTIRSLLEQRLQASPPRYITLYGHGPGGRFNDTSVMQDGVTTFVHADIPADYGADLEGANAVLTALKDNAGARTLLVHVGHSGPTGLPLWGRLGTVSTEELTAAGRDAAGSLVMVSGGCHSGIFASAVQCGFFAAHPDVLASGCQLSEEAIASSDDYLKLFFEGLQRSPDTADPEAAEVTLEGAHWYASTRVEDHQLSYTSVDALVDAYFAAAPNELPDSVSVAQLRRVAERATPAEARAFAELTATLSEDFAVSLDDIVRRNHDAQAKLDHSTELSSAERNAIIALPYKLMLPMLARRLLYRAAQPRSATLRETTACETQSIEEFLAPP